MVSMRYLVDRLWKRYRKQGEGTGLVEYPPPPLPSDDPQTRDKVDPETQANQVSLYLCKVDGGLSGISLLENSRENDLPVTLGDGDWISPFPVSLNKLTGCGANI